MFLCFYICIIFVLRQGWLSIKEIFLIKPSINGRRKITTFCIKSLKFHKIFQQKVDFYINHLSEVLSIKISFIDNHP